jgi:hypothetical protein
MTLTAPPVPTLGDIRIDKEDRHVLDEHPWYLKLADGQYDVWANESDGNGRRRTLLLRRVVMNAPAGSRVTSLDGDNLNCHRSNLAFATMAQVQAGQAPQRTAKVPFKGIDFYSPGGKWRARLAGRHLGYFPTAESAAHCYAVAARERYGVFARNGGQVLTGDGQ